MLSEFQRPKLRELSARSLACGEQRNCKNGPSLSRTMSEILLVFAFLPAEVLFAGKQCVAKRPAQCRVHRESHQVATGMKCKLDLTEITRHQTS
jgi:hypothetical protein